MRFQTAQRSIIQRTLAQAGALSMAFLLAACGSSVDLNSAAGAPVDDRTATTGAGGAVAGGAGGSAISGSNIGSSSEAAYNALIKVVYFDFDSSQVRPEFNSGLEAKAQYLLADRTRRVKLEGHTDERGGSEYNLALGQQRAEAVRRSLSVLGVSEAQMEAVSYGKEKLADTGADETAHANNRRVELSR